MKEPFLMTNLTLGVGKANSLLQKHVRTAIPGSREAGIKPTTFWLLFTLLYCRVRQKHAELHRSQTTTAASSIILFSHLNVKERMRTVSYREWAAIRVHPSARRAEEEEEGEEEEEAGIRCLNLDWQLRHSPIVYPPRVTVCCTDAEQVSEWTCACIHPHVTSEASHNQAAMATVAVATVESLRWHVSQRKPWGVNTVGTVDEETTHHQK